MTNRGLGDIRPPYKHVGTCLLGDIASTFTLHELRRREHTPQDLSLCELPWITHRWVSTGNCSSGTGNKATATQKPSHGRWQ